MLFAQNLLWLAGRRPREDRSSLIDLQDYFLPAFLTDPTMQLAFVSTMNEASKPLTAGLIHGFINGRFQPVGANDGVETMISVLRLGAHPGVVCVLHCGEWCRRADRRWGAAEAPRLCPSEEERCNAPSAPHV